MAVEPVQRASADLCTRHITGLWLNKPQTRSSDYIAVAHLKTAFVCGSGLSHLLCRFAFIASRVTLTGGPMMLIALRHLSKSEAPSRTTFGVNRWFGGPISWPVKHRLALITICRVFGLPVGVCVWKLPW